MLVIGNVNVDLILGPQGAWPVLGTEVLMDHLDFRVGGSVGYALFGSWLRHAISGGADAVAGLPVTVPLPSL